MFFPAVFPSAFDKRLSLCTEKIFQTDGVCPVNLCLGIFIGIVPPFCVVFGVDFGAFVPLYAR